jgi:hypothetical protein
MRSRFPCSPSTRSYPIAVLALASVACGAAAAPWSLPLPAPLSVSALAPPPVAAVKGEPLAAPSQAAAAFELLKELQGTWKGWSSKGWEETITLQLIANGSVLAESSQFTDDPAGRNRMATMYQLDGERMLLTHYCEAGNTPRLVATGFEDGGRTLIFTFLDGLNLPSRDRGHMDKVILRLHDASHFSSRWTWYQDGKESWLEDIRYERVH